MPSPKRRTGAKPRRRRDAATMIAAILDATERRLAEAGPSGIRLKEIAADTGVSHPNVLHHFGSREALVGAVIARSMDALNARLVAAIGAASGQPDELAAIFESVYAALSESGSGRTLFWLALEGYDASEGGATSLSELVTAAHAARVVAFPGTRATREDTAHVVLLSALALTSAPVLYPSLAKNAGLPHDEAAGRRFRAWLAKILIEHMAR